MFKHKHVIFGPTIVVTSFVLITPDQHYFLHSHFLSQSYNGVNGVGENFTELAVRKKNLMTNSLNVLVNDIFN